MLRHVLIDTQDSMDDVAERLRKLLTQPGQNAIPDLRVQQRDGDNRGGLYYLFEGSGFTFELMRNSGLSTVSEDHAAPLYVWIHTDTPDDDQVVDEMARHCIRILNSAGIAAEGYD